MTVSVTLLTRSCEWITKNKQILILVFTVLPLPGASAEAPVPLLNWEIVHEKMPWNILLLLGGGFALAHGSEVRPPPSDSIINFG